MEKPRGVDVKKDDGPLLPPSGLSAAAEKITATTIGDVLKTLDTTKVDPYDFFCTQRDTHGMYNPETLKALWDWRGKEAFKEWADAQIKRHGIGSDIATAIETALNQLKQTNYQS